MRWEREGLAEAGVKRGSKIMEATVCYPSHSVSSGKPPKGFRVPEPHDIYNEEKHCGWGLSPRKWSKHKPGWNVSTPAICTGVCHLNKGNKPVYGK